MRHRHGPRKLNITDGAHRRAMMRHICCALIQREQIITTLPRAKELRRFVEPLITLGKTPSVHNRRLAMSRLQERQSAAKLFDDLGVRFGARPGGYVRIIKNGFRKGDNAPMALVEFVDKKSPETAEAPDAPQKSAKAAKAAKPAKVAKAAKTAKAAKPAKKDAAAKPAKTTKAAKPSTKSAADKTAKSAKSGGAEDSGAEDLQQSGKAGGKQ